MLSIGKLTAGQEAYYEEQVAQGRDDYYSGRGEAPGRWTGRLAAELGLEGQVSSEAFAALLLEGKDPRTGEPLRAASRVTAYDFTFSAPKSVSVLFAIADDETSEALREAHDEAVDAALGWLEREAVCARRGKAGRERVAASGLVAGAYRHRMSRAGDPQLHTHVVAANVTRGPDGRWGALHAYPAYQAAKAAGCLYEAELRAAVRERLPWVGWGPVRNGIAEIEGVSQGVLAEFSQRRAQILEWVAEHGAADAGRRFENAVMATRERKQYGIDTPTWREETRARAGEHGFGRAQLEALMARELDAGELAVTDGEAARRAYGRGGQEGLEALLGAELAGPGGLTRVRNTFARRHAVEAVAGAARQGARAAEVEARVTRFFEREDVRAVADPQEARYTTDDLLAHERAIVDGAARRMGEGAGRVERAVVELVLAGWPVALNDGQRAAIERLTASGRGLEHVEALAGTGKTTMLGAVAEIYRQAGYRVIGTAKTARAVRELKERAGVPESWTGRSLLGSLERHGGGLGRGPVVVLFDEAGMAETREASRIVAQAEADGAKVIAVGDSGQLTSVEAGGWLGALTRRFGAIELTEVMRQRDKAERDALGAVRDGRPEPHLRLQRGRGALTVAPTPPAGEEHAVGAWWDAQRRVAHGQAVMVARDNARRERLNDAARERLKAHGLLPRAGVVIGGREFAVGDRVIARRNDRLRDVDNGMRATVVAVDPEGATVTIEADAGGRRELDRGYVEQHLEHAYALTGHGTQGGTLERAVVVGRPEEFSRNWGYTALSRAREGTQVVLISERRANAQREELAPGDQLDRSREETLEAMARALREPDAEDLALEQLHARVTGADVERGAETPIAQPVAQEAAADRLDAQAAHAAADDAERSARNAQRRETVQVPDPLQAERRALGPERAGRLPEPTPAGRAWLAERPDRELADLQTDNAGAVARLDASGAYQAARLEEAAAAASVGRDRALGRLAELQARRAELGVLRRAERGQLDEEIGTQQRTAGRWTRELEQIGRDAEALHAAGRHPDQWIEQDGHAAVTWAEATRERAVRRELAVRDAGDRAVTDAPAHVRDAVGPRPEPGRDRERWDELARALERHRLNYDLDVDRHGPLGPEPAAYAAEYPNRDLAAYERARRELAGGVREHRAARGLEPAGPAAAVEPQPDVGLEL